MLANFNISRIKLNTIFAFGESKYPIAYNEISCSQRREANLMYYYKTASETKLVEETEHGQIAMT